MKKILSTFLLCFVFLMGLSAIGFAEEPAESSVESSTENQVESPSLIQQWLEPAAGDWYSTKGNFVMTIQGNTINGCEILEIKDYTLGYPRSGTFEVVEANDTRNMKLELFGNKEHQYIIVDDNMMLRRSVNPEYNESMGGIYLGMTKNDLIGLYKQPTRVATENGLDKLYYDSHNFAVLFKNNIIVAIRMFKDSDRHFDKSGLGVTNTAEDYAKAYGFETPVIPTDPNAVSQGYKIDDGEFLHFSPAYVELSVYNN